MNLPHDVKDYRAPMSPLGLFQLVKPEVAEFLVICGIAGVIVFGVLPDLHAWIEGKMPVKECQ